MALMKSTHHAIQKEKWQAMIQERAESRLSIKIWCAKHQVSEGSYYYWLKTIREDALVRAGTLAVTGYTEFAEIKAKPTETEKQTPGVCAVVHINAVELVIHNGADPKTLATMKYGDEIRCLSLNIFIKKGCFIGARCILGEFLMDFYKDKINKFHPLVIGVRMSRK